MLKIKRILLPLILILILTFTLSVFGADLYGTYDQRIKFTIDNTKIDAAVTWFPVTVFLTATAGEEVFAEFDADADYLKVAFTTTDEATELYAEMELFDDSAELAIYHVSLDGWEIASGADTDFYMYYDNDANDNTDFIGAIDTTAGGNVWDGDFMAVYHMVDATTSTIKDSTSNSHDGTKKAANEPASAAGKVGLGQNFDGSDDKITITDHADFDFAAGFTLEALVDPVNTDADEMIMGHYDDSSADGYYLRQNTTDSGVYRFYVWVASTQKLATSDAAPSGAFEYVAGTRDGDGLLILYVDSVAQAATDTNNGAIDSSEDFYMGTYYDGTGYNFEGIGDEFRVSDTNRVAAWLKATFNTLWNTLLTYGDEESAPEESITSKLFTLGDF